MTSPDAAAAASSAAAASAGAPSGRTTITVHANGPLEVQGETVVVADDGTELRETRRAYLCRCGGSSKKPFCDGTHRRIEFTDDGLGTPQ